MSEAAIAKKAEIVKQTTDMLNAAQSAIVVDYRGLTVAEGTDYEDLRSTFVGPTAVAFSDEDPIAPAKILKKFADDHDALEIKGGFIEKSVKTLDEINEYANMPGREELLSMLASALQDPMRKIARAVKAIADKEDEAA